MSAPTNTVPQAAHAFRRFFAELREAFLERETLFLQLELALLCKEHVLVVGPPGTAKSAIASAVLARILDAKTGAPSLFAKQLSESTVQTDLIGPVDFKVLTETGRTEYLTDDGMLGATYGFLDEVFDGRDMLLRSILNVLHERELKHGRRLTPGRLETAIMTSNRYLSEVLARSPEMLLAFADRLSFVCFVPKSFARPSSRAAMLARSVKGQRPELRAELTVQQLDVLQEQVDKVQIPSAIAEGLELLADQLERLLLAQVAKLPDYVPTKYFSQRSVVKALWALKAAVVRDAIWRHPERPLVATERDLEALRAFFLLGGPPPAETEALLKVAADPRERAQLEILRLEHRAFDEAMGKVRAQLGTGVEREAESLRAREDVAAADSLLRGYGADTVIATAKALREKLVPGPRHPANRVPLVSAARGLLSAAEARMARGISAQGEGRAGVAVLQSLTEVLELARVVPELHPRVDTLASELAAYIEQAVEMIGLAAESTEFDEGVRLESLVGLASNLDEELSHVREVLATLEGLSPERVEKLRAREQHSRGRVAASLRRRAVSVFKGTRGRRSDFETLAADSRRLGQLEDRLRQLSPDQEGLREELLGPLGGAYARDVLSSTPFTRIQQLGAALQSMAENLRREGIDPGRIVAEQRELLETRLRAHAAQLAAPQPPLPQPNAMLSGEAYTLYRSELTGANVPEGELSALVSLEGQWVPATGSAGAFLSAAVKDAVAKAELSLLERRVVFLRTWLTHVLTALPEPAAIKDKAEADRAFDRLVKSRFPMLTMKEGELVRLEGALRTLVAHPGPIGASAQTLQRVLQSLSENFGDYSRRLLEVRATLA